jgi:hypothetical protein
MAACAAGPCARDDVLYRDVDVRDAKSLYVRLRQIPLCSVHYALFNNA